MTIKGACLCGEVTVVVDSDHDFQVACHCTDCQHTSGSAFSTNVIVKDKELHVTGPTGTYVSLGKSGNPVTRTFCAKCGSAISHKSVLFGDASAVQTGNLLEHFKNIPFKTELFAKSRFSGLKEIDGASQE